MNNRFKLSIIALFIFNFSFSQSAKEIVKKSDQIMRGEYSQQEMVMTIVRPEWERKISFKTWSHGTEFSMIYITSPPKEKGQVFMKRHNEMWHWLPSIDRMIKLPPSMMMQSWMGSDFTNDDLIKESSIVEDYKHELLGEEEIRGAQCYKIQLIPLPDAAVVWGKIIAWIGKEDYIQRKIEFYDEDDYLINTQTLSNIKQMGDRKIPTHWEMVPAEDENKKTIIDIENADFDTPVQESFFTQQNMKRVR